MKAQNPKLSMQFGKMFFSKKPLRLFWEICISIIVLLIVIVAIFLGRLALGPLSLDFILPGVEEAFKAPQLQISASIDHAQLVWKDWKRPFEIELINVNIKKAQNPHWLKIEHIEVSLNLPKLLTGRVSLKDLRFSRPHILLEKDEKGEFTLGFGESQPNQHMNFGEIAPFLALGGSHPSLGKLNDLKKISIIDAHILLKDDKEKQSWELPKVTVNLKRHAGGFRTELSLRPHQGRGSLTVSVAHNLKTSRADIDATFDHISLKDIINKERMKLTSSGGKDITPDDVFNFFQHWGIPLNGQLHLTLNPQTLQLIEGKGQIDIGKGTIGLSRDNRHPIPINSGNLSFLITQKGIDLKNLSLLSDGMRLTLSGTLDSPAPPLLLNDLLGPDKRLELKGQVKGLFLNRLATLWPEDLAAKARSWVVENLREGTVTQGTFSLKGHGMEDSFVLGHLNGSLEGQGLEVTYLKGLPPAQNINAKATFTQKGFDIHLLSGNIKGIELQTGHMILSNLDANDEALSLDLALTGPLSDIFDVINHKPLEYAAYGGIDPKKVKGEGKATLHIAFPLLSDLELKDVKIAAKGSFKKVGIERKITDTLKAHLTQADLDVKLTQDQMEVKGKGLLNKIPSHFTYTQFFKKAAPYELRIGVETDLSFEDFKHFGFDYQDYGEGYTATKLTYILGKNKESQLLVDLDTTDAHLHFPPLGWEKKPGERGNISFSLHFMDGQLSRLANLTMDSFPYFLQGEILFGPEKKWRTIHLSRFKGPHTDVQLTLHSPQENVYEVSCSGQSVNLEQFLEYVSREENAAHHAPTDIRLSTQVGQLRLGEGRVFEDVQASADLFLQGQDTFWNAVKLRAKAGKNVAHSEKSDVTNVAGGVLFDITPGPHNTQTLEIRANDAGKFLKTLGIYDSVKGGYIVVKATRNNQGPYAGEFRLKDFNVNKVPVLARFAALLSPMGIANLFSEKETLSMDRFECNFQFSEDQIVVSKGIGKSIALGFTVEGKLDRKNRLYALKGNVTPARFINSILDNIPLVGSLLNGGEGEGLFAIAYTVSGSFDNPSIDLNPLSALAPGFFRKLFQSLGD